MNTEFVRVNPNDIVSSEQALRRAAKIIRDGGLVVFPTETVYGLGADGTSAEAAEKIFRAKGRPSDNPLILHISAPAEAEKYAFTSAVYYRLAESFMPGPLTVIMNAKDTVPLATRGGLATVAVRCPRNPIARRLIEYSGKPIAAPSANLSGSPSPTTAQHALDDMEGRVEMIIDGGECDIGLESTIVKIEEDMSLTLLRPGKITVEQLSAVAPLNIADAVTDRLADGQTALSPGMKYRHYAPSAPVILLDGELSDCIQFISEAEGSVCVICYDEDRERISQFLPKVDLFSFGSREDEAAQAHRLFAILRSTDEKSYDTIFAPLPKKRGIGLALYNRMIRAAAHTIINLRR